MTIGIVEVRRIARQTSRPSRRGSITSSRTRSNGSAREPLESLARRPTRSSTVKPAARSPIAVTSRIDGSSSTSRIRASTASLVRRRDGPAVGRSMPARDQRRLVGCRAIRSPGIAAGRPPAGRRLRAGGAVPGGRPLVDRSPDRAAAARGRAPLRRPPGALPMPTADRAAGAFGRGPPGRRAAWSAGRWRGPEPWRDPARCVRRVRAEARLVRAQRPGSVRAMLRRFGRPVSAGPPPRGHRRAAAALRALADRLGPDRAVRLEARRSSRSGSGARAATRSRAGAATRRRRRARSRRRRAGAAGPADPVDVVLGDHRQLEVDDVRQRVDVEAARRRPRWRRGSRRGRP